MIHSRESPCCLSLFFISLLTQIEGKFISYKADSRGKFLSPFPLAAEAYTDIDTLDVF
ncbi:hypothetical protein GcC1_c1380o27 [Golovinomyces cichoracearum]|uniref:Uncharacterized protein n=1 Tax=Golovinomyces cichoracearum TaxID=62708 RepID=A0A420J2K2_9PEZI|nr:hypothetical protein GcC1_c1380o27 [Golovinomyces cichoracearum]